MERSWRCPWERLAPLPVSSVSYPSGRRVIKSWAPASRCHAFFIGCIQLTVADIFHNGSREQVRILQNNAQCMTQITFSDLVDIDAVIADLAICNIVKTVQQIGYGGFTSTRCTTKATF